jgi:hypothetical protein
VAWLTADDDVGTLESQMSVCSHFLDMVQVKFPTLVISQNLKCAVFWGEVSGYAGKDQESRQ